MPLLKDIANCFLVFDPALSKRYWSVFIAGFLFVYVLLVIVALLYAKPASFIA